jgi:hypothetical protein
VEKAEALDQLVHLVKMVLLVQMVNQVKVVLQDQRVLLVLQV